MRFRPEQHLRRQSDIRVVREQGRRVDCRAFTVWWKHRDIAPELTVAPHLPRVCVVASTAAVGNAVRRNRAKRRLREVAREILPTGARAGWDYVLVAKPGVTTLRDYALLLADLRGALGRIHKP